MTRHAPTSHRRPVSGIRLASTWLMAMVLLLAPALTDVCAAMCAMPPSSHARASMPAQGASHDDASHARHCGAPGARHAHPHPHAVADTQIAATGTSEATPAAATRHESVASASADDARDGASAAAASAHGERIGAPRATHTGLMPALAPSAHDCLLHARTGAPSGQAARAVVRAKAADTGRMVAAAPLAHTIAWFDTAHLRTLDASALRMPRPAPLPLHRPLRV